MADPTRAARNALLAVAAVSFLGLGAVALALFSPGEPGDGPANLAWDREVCAHCHMHVGDPAFAAQLRDADGRLLAFDDPGCLFEWLAAHPHARVDQIYFHGSDGVPWLAARDTAFVRETPTPMGFGWKAVRAGTPGARPYDDLLTSFRGDHVPGGQP